MQLKKSMIYGKDSMWLEDRGHHVEGIRRNWILPTTCELGREP